MNPEKCRSADGSFRVASIGKKGDENIGVCIFLTSDQLRDLEINPAETEAVTYKIVNINGTHAVRITELEDAGLSDTTSSMTD